MKELGDLVWNIDTKRVMVSARGGTGVGNEVTRTALNEHGQHSAELA